MARDDPHGGDLLRAQVLLAAAILFKNATGSQHHKENDEDKRCPEDYPSRITSIDENSTRQRSGASSCYFTLYSRVAHSYFSVAALQLFL